MKQAGAVAIGKLIEAHKKGDEAMFDSYANFIADAYEEAGDERAARIIRKRLSGKMDKEGVVTLDEAEGGSTMEKSNDKLIIEMNTAIKSNNERGNNYTESILITAKEKILTMNKLLEKAAEELENVYGRETELSKEIREVLLDE